MSASIFNAMNLISLELTKLVAKNCGIFEPLFADGVLQISPQFFFPSSNFLPLDSLHWNLADMDDSRLNPAKHFRQHWLESLVAVRASKTPGLVELLIITSALTANVGLPTLLLDSRCNTLCQLGKRLQIKIRRHRIIHLTRLTKVHLANLPFHDLRQVDRRGLPAMDTLFPLSHP